MMPVIYQGDQYYIPIKITRNGVAVTPENADEINVSIGGHVQSYPDGDLTFDGSGMWLFALKADMSSALIGLTPYQVQVKKGDIVQHSSKRLVEVDGSLFGGVL